MVATSSPSDRPRMGSSFQISSRALTHRPVAARVISYGRSAKMAQHATLYVLRVARGRKEWYVARRYSEFRALYTTLQSTLVQPHGPHPRRMCAQCRELARRFPAVAFPSRFRVRSGFASAREKIESARMQQLDAFVQVLMETTRGLLASEDDDEDDGDMFFDADEEDECDREDRCDALRTIREFLLVHEHLHDDKKDADKASPTSNQPSASSTPAATPRRPRLQSSGSGSTTTFRVQELDVIYRPTSPLSTWVGVGSVDALTSTAVKVSSPNVMDEQELDELFLADYAEPAEDAVIHRQLEGDASLGMNGPTAHVLRRSETLRMSRRL